MKKIGIMTHYYNSSNYGGLLQAYALSDFLNSIDGIEAEQIQYNSLKYESGILRSIIHDLHVLYLNLKKSSKIRLREKSCERFRDDIRHSSRVYSYKDIHQANDDYDVFIVGSDQVWNPRVFNRGYSLAFTKKPKFAFSASIAADTIPDLLLDKYRDSLSDYEMISVRERNAQELLSFRNDIILTMDPVFLISEDEWKRLASPRLIKDKYIFTYFLGDDIHARDVAKRIADKYSYKIINIPFLLGKKRACDVRYGDILKNDASPNDFLSLVLNAELVLTDSFHGICFSYIFKKDFYAFKRKSGEHMNSRIVDILFTLGLENRYIDNVENINNIDYTDSFTKYNELYSNTVNYFKKMVNKLEKIEKKPDNSL